MTKRILQISNYYYPNFGGIEQVARDIANALKSDSNIEQRVICFNETASDGDYVCHRNETIHDTVDGVEVIRCGCITKKSSQSISLTFPRELKKVMNSFKPDVVIFHYPNPYQAFFLLPYIEKQQKNIVLILYWHLDIVKQKVLKYFFNRQTKTLLKRANQIIATSPLYIDGSPYLSKYREKCAVIPNCINEERLKVTDEIRNRAEQIRTENKDKIICFAIGRHVPYKGLQYLVEASTFLDDRFRIFIGGQGELTEDLKRRAKDDKKITFLGRIDDNEMVAYYSAMDIFCFPSITKNEAFGVALAEGMYFGKPAITFEIPGSGVNYVNLKDITGLEVRNRDSRAYAEAVKKLAGDEELRIKLGIVAEQWIKSSFLKRQFDPKIISIITPPPHPIYVYLIFFVLELLLLRLLLILERWQLK